MLVKRGGCTFSEKAQAVDAAHAAALIVYNNDEGQQGRYLPEHSLVFMRMLSCGPHMAEHDWL